MFNTLIFLAFLCREQPPSGGCVLKPDESEDEQRGHFAATFGWLCVETEITQLNCPVMFEQPPSGGCVLKLKVVFPEPVAPAIAATFGWLCVETMDKIGGVIDRIKSSHLRVAVC